ncbi:hypothetical protein EMIT0194MI4_20732 [Pseudomonas sp. IT-194MI4]|nr:hypothetical protein PGR6_25630 [Pseudomonas sp. GR 6-02]
MRIVAAKRLTGTHVLPDGVCPLSNTNNHRLHPLAESDG